MTGMLVRVVAPHFVAGLVIEDGVCAHAAPKLRWCEGRTREWLSAYFRRKGWRAAIVSR